MMEAMSVNEVLIYFSDLTEEAQQRVLAAAGIQDPKEANWDSDIVPLATILRRSLINCGSCSMTSRLCPRI